MNRLIRKMVPEYFLNLYRLKKKKRQELRRNKDQRKGRVFNKQYFIRKFRKIGIKPGDTLLVHSSLSKIGFVENGAKDIVEALLEVVGDKGNVLMPNSPNAGLQLDYIRSLDFFDVANAPSKLGAVSEYFRKLPDAVRSEHPTEPVSCIGPDTEFLVGHHFGNETPYNKNSPFYRITELNGKILYLGVSLDNAGTSLHVLEDLIENFKFPVYYPESFDIKVRFENRTLRSMQTFVHNPDQSKKRKCNGLIPLFEERGVLKHVMVGKAKSLLVDAKGMLDVMLEEYKKKGVTMYTPKGS